MDQRFEAANNVRSLEESRDARKAYDRKQVSSLVPVSALPECSLIPTEAKRTLDAFLSEEPAEGLAVSAPDAHGYEFQSPVEIEMLEKEEAISKHAFEMLVPWLHLPRISAEGIDFYDEMKAAKLLRPESAVRARKRPKGDPSRLKWKDPW